jgi:hypothetical protein
MTTLETTSVELTINSPRLTNDEAREREVEEYVHRRTVEFARAQLIEMGMSPAIELSHD